jgi:integrase/recombinase XerD
MYSQFQITMRILFWHRLNKLNSRKESAVQCRITINGQRCNSFSTGVFAQEGDFIPKLQKIKNDIDNLKLQNIRHRIEVLNLDLENKGVEVTAELLKEYYLGKKSLDMPLLKLMGEYYTFRDNQCKLKQITDGTLARFSVCQSVVKEYLTVIGKTNISVNQINADFGERLYYWMQTDKKVKCGAEYSAKMVSSTLKKCLDFGIRKGYRKEKVNELQGLGLKRGEIKEVVFLSVDQVDKMEAFKFNDKLRRVADLFLFQCYTGFAYEDMAQFNPIEHIEVANNGVEYLVKPRQKTKQLSVLKYSEQAKRIVEKYSTINLLNEKICKLPLLANQKYNEYLKVIAEHLDIEINLTSHVGRKTFGTIALNEGYSIEEVSAMLGISDIKIAQRHYAKIIRKENLGKVI